ncbi:MAG: 6-carboxytetrahydropterin synthase [Candidatus Marinimicrobia bacterium]|jgi:6-pyruvoyltetrahydropterin/6-carboxytetrahydropterin synthase|nr:6-carboxytetrahydropterin synthase [Candidatus Neomarinimicrobiota bacterium]MBT3502074.1 6-carboxytetrahydropterin synthase [Candidatus Neomarinimicrobiota bacterium]MBT3840483.1 6-carboxytetrahydropterin synthase [Candidatus Neomarinimicrobiota bacterium]MBT3999963.1 6-carboxytetrahydropterin synthase [Candidatus Neomarinimicrobiota bacterium]MBT4283498.1 6-carboxytetrahydropterin synthase [Candidatus Neomarinimicrobiota bacterium]
MSNPIITKKYHFCASHKYGNSEWSDEKNYEVFGKDYNTHGHNYILEVSVTGPVDPKSGWLIDLSNLNKIVDSKVVNVLDHSQIEKDVSWFHSRQPSSENILIWAWTEIAPNLERGKLQRLRLVETNSIYTDYYGPEEL